MNIRMDILNYYMHELTSEELANFDNLTEYDLRLIVNRIWHNFLSNDFKLGEKFKFLGTFLSPIELIEEENITGRDYGYVRLLSSDDLSFTSDEMDLITDIDWTKAKKLYLPVHFKGKSFYIEGGVSFKGIMVANNGEGVINPAVDYAKNNPLNLPFYNLDLRYYGIENKIDYNKIVLDVICYYIIDEYQAMDFKLRKELIKKYRKFITSSYSSMREYCTGEEILEFMVKHIRLKERNVEIQTKI